VKTIADFLEILKALSDETRYNLVRLLIGHDYCVRALARKLEISESAVSQHLKILRTAGLVKGEKRGYFTHYSVDKETLKQTAGQIITLAELPKTNPKCHDSISSKPSCHKCKGE